ncbi:MotA/TolQ/ExbB proton channel family protein [Mesorhizobium sp.]|uniref:MotA/TolQ/ExbB proton channel family protein n=1 Tax=Mesorhizobium sp. TaxID=1871066 RepID=UPI000FEAB3C8|nr:MotA/TolQ/ExbB proton channel family protein [Mesorhizobium sp.]RWB26414.1 MAG: hypothetical protein EOQ43_30835 [Mesorhizobium sp.]
MNDAVPAVRASHDESPGVLDRHLIHFAPDKVRLLSILAIALGVTILCFGLVMELAYGRIKNFVEKANVVESTLRAIPNFPIGPEESTGAMKLEAAPLEAAGAFKILRAWGVFGSNLEIERLLQRSKDVEEESLILNTLIECTNSNDFGGSTVGLLRCSLGKFGGGTDTTEEENCLWLGAGFALSGYPDSVKNLAKQIAAHLTKSEAPPCSNDFNYTDTLRFAFDWFGTARDDASILRSMLLGSRVLGYPSTQVQVGMGQEKLPSWSSFSALQLRFLEETLSRLESDSEVKRARSWLVLWRGPEQFFLVFTGIALLLLLGDRVWQRRQIKREAGQILVRLHEALDEVQKTKDPKARSTAARSLAQRLERREGDKTHSSFVTVPDDGKGLGVRIDSVALYMAEKAVRRIVIEPREPELFRQICDGINAEVERSGWVLRYASRALPAIGFIGTVRGIMLALPAAQGLFGTSGPAQIAALNDVIEPLGLAFATTLIALVAGLVTGLLGDWEMAQEQVLLSRIEDSLIDRIDPAEL